MPAHCHEYTSVISKLSRAEAGVLGSAHRKDSETIVAGGSAIEGRTYVPIVGVRAVDD